HRLDSGKTRLRTLVKDTVDTLPRLPLIHNTDSYTLEDVLADSKVSPHGCTVFTGEALVYLFYGRPAFRPNLDAEPTALKHYFPVFLIFKPTWATKIRRVFPFDSGAFQNEFYRNYVHRKMRLGDFALEPDMTSPGKIVFQFFGSNPAYLLGKP